VAEQRPIRVEVPGRGIVEFPAGTSEDTMRQALASLSSPAKPEPETEAAPFNAPRMVTDPRAKAGEFVLGAVKAVPRAVLQLGQAVSETTGFGDPAKFTAAREQLAPQGGAQQAGAMAGDIGLALAPAGMINRAGKAASAAVTGARALANAPSWARTALGIGAAAAVEGAGAAATAVPLGADPKSAAMLGAAGSGLANTLVKAAPALGARIEQSLIKAGTPDVQDGFKVQNVFKHKLGGTLVQTYEKAQAKLNALGQKMQSILSGSPARVDLVDVLAQTEKELASNVEKTFGSNAKLKNALAEMLDEIDELSGKAPGGVADLVTANRVRQAVGELGAWMHDPSGKNRDAAGKAMEVMANAYYRNLRKAIDTASGRAPEIQALNRDMSEIIPIVNAVVRRIPVAERANVLKLGDKIGFGTGHIGLVVANRLLQSGRVANVLSNGPAMAGRGASAIPALMPSHEVKR